MIDDVLITRVFENIIEKEKLVNVQNEKPSRPYEIRL